MKLDHDLKPQKLFNRAREAGINPNHWYPVAWADRLRKGEIRKVTVWKQQIVLYRTQSGAVHALQNACLHKGVELHKGDIENEEIVCPYHGWRFNGQGACTDIPYLAERQNLPKKCIRRYPLRERYNLIWLFPGDAGLAESRSLPEVPEYDDPDWLIVEIPAHFQVHFSLINENPLDVFHGHLHRDLQGWYSPRLIDLQRSEDAVTAAYEVTFKNGWLPRFLGLTQSRDPEIQGTIEVGYHYPHCRNSFPGKSNYYFMRQPVGPDETRSFSLLCLKVRLPKWLVRLIRRPLSYVFWRFLVKPFLDQDVDVMESEQRNYHRDPNRQYVEINPVIAAAQRLTLEQAEMSASDDATNCSAQTTKDQAST